MTSELAFGVGARVRVVHVITTLVSGGTERMLERLVLATQGRTLDHEVISLVGGGVVAENLAAAGIPVHSLDMRRDALVPDPFALLKLRALLRQARADVIQGWMYHANLLAGLAAPLAGVARPVWGIRAASLPVGRERARTILTARVAAALAAVLSRGVVVNGERARTTHIAQGYPARLFEIIPNGYDLQRWRPDPASRQSVRRELGLDARTPLVGYIANFRPIKDHATFFAAARRLLDTGSAAHFLVAGVDADDSNPSFRALIDAQGLAGVVHAVGEREDVVRLTQALDVASLTSVDESFPNVLAEAMACGVPVVSTDAGDAAMILGPLGRVHEVGDAEGIAEDWRMLLALTDGERTTLGAKLRARVRDEYSMSAVAARYERYYRRLAWTDS